MAWWLWRSGDAVGFKMLACLASMYALMSLITYSILNMRFIEPLGHDVPLDRFSEACAIDRIRVLAHNIGSRQEGSKGLREAARYIKSQLELLRERAWPELKFVQKKFSMHMKWGCCFCYMIE